MAELSSPISGGIRVARSRVSSSAFTGRFVPQTAQQPQSDPIVAGLIRANTLQLQRVSESVSGINSQMVAVDTTLRSVLQNLEANQALERQREAQEQNQDRILAQQKLLEGKENAIEKKIRSSLVAPIAKIAPKVQFTLQRLMGFLQTIFAGWLINQGLEAIKAAAEGNKEKLEEIKNTVLMSLGVVGGIMLAINGGLTLLLGTLSRIGFKIIGAVAKGVFISLPKLIFDGIRNGFGSVGKAATKTKPTLTPQVDTKTKPKADTKVKPDTKVKSDTKTTKDSKVKTGAGLGLNIGLGIGSELLSGEDPDRAIAGGLAGGLASSATTGLLGRLPLPAIFKLPLMFGAGAFSYYGGSEFLGKPALEFLKGNIFGPDDEEENVSPSSAADQSGGLGSPDTTEEKNPVNPISSTDQSNKLNSTNTEKNEDKKSMWDSNIDLTAFSFDTSTFFGSGSDEPNFEAEPSARVDLNVGPTEETKETLKAQISPSPTSKRGDMVSKNLSSLTEPAPTILPLPTSDMKSEQKQSPQLASGSGSSSVPSFATADASNIYTPTTKSLFGVIA